VSRSKCEITSACELAPLSFFAKLLRVEDPRSVNPNGIPSLSPVPKAGRGWVTFPKLFQR
jgi:hypothetical protein